MFDTHAHYTDARFRDDLDTILSRIEQSSEIKGVIEASVDIEDSAEALKLTEKCSKFYAAVGVHPSESADAPCDFCDRLRRIISGQHRHRIVAIGEIGLDYHYDTPERTVQKDVFDRQLSLSEETGLPCVIHDREAHGDVLDILRAHSAVGVLHSFSGSIETARILLDRGWYISFSGVVTFQNAKNVRETAAFIPSDRLLVETDCPYLAPVPFRVQRNDSFLMRNTLEFLAGLRRTGFEELESVTECNTRTLFRLNSNERT